MVRDEITKVVKATLLEWQGIQPDDPDVVWDELVGAVEARLLGE